jgi:hypothetical protein
MFGQSAVLPPAPWLGRVEGVVVPSVDGSVVVLGADEAPGSGLAAETTAAAPPTRSNAESAAVSTVRLRPGPVVRVAAGSGGEMGAGWSGVRGAGDAGWSCHSMLILLRIVFAGWVLDRWCGQVMGTSGPVGSGVDCAGGPASPCADLDPIVATRSERVVRDPGRRRRCEQGCGGECAGGYGPDGYDLDALLPGRAYGRRLSAE